MIDTTSNQPGVVSDGTQDIAAREVPAWKRALDLLCIFLALPALAPLLFAIAAGIKVLSRGPVFFRQDRVGFSGKRFTCLKFRTMHVNADSQIHKEYFKQLMQSQAPMTKLDSYGDPRLIPLGGLLRATGLDELPQVFNVLGGDMSLVGPRPCTPNEYEDYLPWQRQRFATLPGLTGLWQVSGKNKTTFNEMIQLDILYIQNRSLWLDLKIMLKTFPVILAQAEEMPGVCGENSRTVSAGKAPLAGEFAPGSTASTQSVRNGRLAGQADSPDAEELR